MGLRDFSVTKRSSKLDRHKEARSPEPRIISGTVFLHCAYGPPNYGESPDKDSQEIFAVLVLDRPLPELCSSSEGDECERDVAMLQISTLEESPVPRAAALAGRRVRLSVSEYTAATTGHHHSRIVVWYNASEELGPSPQGSLRPLWPRLKSDFLGVSCRGYPR